MGKASSAKKVARAQRAGGRGSRGGQRRSLLFPATITIVCVLGVALIFYARSQDEAEALEPGLTDHWHAAYGIDICGTLAAARQTNDADPNGIHTHGDGVMHIHPGAAQQVARAGEDATLGVFMSASGGRVDRRLDHLPRSRRPARHLHRGRGPVRRRGRPGPGRLLGQRRRRPTTPTRRSSPRTWPTSSSRTTARPTRSPSCPRASDILPPTTVDQLDELAGHRRWGHGPSTPSTTAPGDHACPAAARPRSPATRRPPRRRPPDESRRPGRRLRHPPPTADPGHARSRCCRSWTGR